MGTPDDADTNPHHAGARPSTPGSNGPAGAAGGMGVSSERRGPDAQEVRDGEDDGALRRPSSPVEGTGTVGSARDHTDGTTSRSAAEVAATTTDAPEETAPVGEDADPEPHPDPVPGHPLGDKNPGHQRS